MIESKQDKFHQLRQDYPKFIYKNYTYTILNQTLIVKFLYLLEGIKNEEFHHSYEIPLVDDTIDITQFETAIFHIGLVESINYWKIVAPKELHIECGNISDTQITWFKKLFFRGLSEYLFVNQIEVSEDELLLITCARDIPKLPFISYPTQESSLIPIGGGKDSLVSYEILKNNLKKSYIFSINPIEASKEILEQNKENSFAVKRNLDMQKILDYNKNGYLNGHIPFSSIVGFCSILLGLLYKSKYIVLSNEASANEGNIEFNNIEVNHQYSKSFEFENDFREYIFTYVTKDVEYFSFLRPLDEITIGKIFAYNHKYFDTFLSCNVGSKKNIWCGKCPKCLFTYIMLCNNISDKEMVQIFGKNLFDEVELENDFRKLTQKDEVKPLECVGTYDEVNFALSKKVMRYKKENKPLPFLLQNYIPITTPYDFKIDFENNHNLNQEFKEILQEYVRKVN